jgi:arylsulfatase A-like enzyme
VRWPGHVQASTVCDETISLVDMYATIAALLGKAIPADEDIAEDSFNVLPSFLGEATQEPLRSSIILHSPNGNFAIRRGPWKYIEGKPSPTLAKVPRRDELGARLYNLENDPGELVNLIDEQPFVAKRLADLLEKQRTDGHSR